MKLAIIGSRTLTDYAWFKDRLMRRYAHESHEEGGYTYLGMAFDEVISGGAIGADRFAAQFVTEWNGRVESEGERGVSMEPIKLTEFIPDWDKHGKRAGFIRNEDIIANCDECWAAWDGKSAGTGNSLSIAKRLKKPTVICYF